jgi:hypothetical protein
MSALTPGGKELAGVHEQRRPLAVPPTMAAHLRWMPAGRLPATMARAQRGSSSSSRRRRKASNSSAVAAVGFSYTRTEAPSVSTVT